MKTKLPKTVLTAVLTSAMALGAGTSLWAQDQSMDKPSAGVSAQVDQGPPPEQLDKLVSPIALYPDSLVAQILAASAYPTQIVEADRMAREHPGLKGRDLAEEVDR